MTLVQSTKNVQSYEIFAKIANLFREGRGRGKRGGERKEGGTAGRPIRIPPRQADPEASLEATGLQVDDAMVSQLYSRMERTKSAITGLRAM